MGCGDSKASNSPPQVAPPSSVIAPPPPKPAAVKPSKAPVEVKKKDPPSAKPSGSKLKVRSAEKPNPPSKVKSDTKVKSLTKVKLTLKSAKSKSKSKVGSKTGSSVRSTASVFSTGGSGVESTISVGSSSKLDGTFKPGSKLSDVQSATGGSAIMSVTSDGLDKLELPSGAGSHIGSDIASKASCGSIIGPGGKSKAPAKKSHYESALDNPFHSVASGKTDVLAIDGKAAVGGAPKKAPSKTGLKIDGVPKSTVVAVKGSNSKIACAGQPSKVTSKIGDAQKSGMAAPRAASPKEAPKDAKVEAPKPADGPAAPASDASSADKPASTVGNATKAGCIVA